MRRGSEPVDRVYQHAEPCEVLPVEIENKPRQRLVLRLVRLLGERRGQGRAIFYNVNFPACAPEETRGIRVTRQSRTFFDDRFREERSGPDGTEYRLYGERKEVEATDEYESRAILNKYIAITPLQSDATAEGEMNILRDEMTTATVYGAAYG